ncbi:MAG: hypothetical protein F4X95_01530 [Oligoflexia bacterium]|nr:hypothetical protein [Oligoflexia bacterium]
MGVFPVFVFFISVFVYCASPGGSGGSESLSPSQVRIEKESDRDPAKDTTCVPGMSGCVSGGTELVTIQEAKMVDYNEDFFFYHETAESMGLVVGRCASFKVQRDKLSDEVDQFLEQGWKKGHTTKVSFHKNSVLSCPLAPPDFCTPCEPSE